MPSKIKSPSIIKAAGNKPKVIEEFVGRVNSKTDEVSIARMKSPSGWIEPGQRPGFDEYTIVLKGELHIKTEKDKIILKESEAIITRKGEWIQYSTPSPEGAEYIAVCLPAFSPEKVNRDDNA
ncbi:MAG: cupin domain-containing protein [Ignavibacteriales bacterium]|nr:MAG: cupin domain-containing protein [Ignavibacteriales bacterium]